MPIATSAVASADAIAWATPQLFAIRSDPGYHDGDYYPGPGPRAGLEVARQIAHTTYRSAGELQDRFGAEPQQGENPSAGGRYAVQSYLEHHGKKLSRRFDANTYVVLTEVMNGHDIGRDRGGVEAALRRITAELTVIVIDSDRLFTPAEGARIAAAPTARELVTVSSPYGHDGFLIETDQVFAAIGDALEGPRTATGEGTPARIRQTSPNGSSVAVPQPGTSVAPSRAASNGSQRPTSALGTVRLSSARTGTGLW